MEKQERKVSLLLGIGILLMPYIFGWFLLRGGHSTKARVLGLGWMAIIISMVFFGEKNTSSSQNTTASSSASQAVATAPAPAAPSSLWNYNSDEDKMRKTITNYASLKSSNELTFDFPYNGGSTAEILLRKSGRSGNDAILRVSKGQFTCPMDCTITAKFDDGKIEKFSAVGPSDGSSDTLFIQNYGRFSTKLKKSKSLVIEAEFFQAG